MLVLIDLANAFNCVSRGAVLSAVRTHFPWLAPWADTCCRHDSNMLIGGSLISSQRGVQQGPSSHLQSTPASLRLPQSRFPGDLDCNSFFLDDGAIAGRSPAVQQIVSTLEERLLEIGQTHCPPFEGFAWVPDGNIKLLGAAVGSQSWCEALLKRRVVKARNLLDAIGRYPGAQGAFTLLRSCSGWAKVLHSCRTVLPPLQVEALSRADQDIRHSLGRLVGAPCLMMIGESPASVWPMVVSAPQCA